MAKIWPVYEGKVPSIGWPWADLPLSEAIALFELRPGDFVSEPAKVPRFGDASRSLTYVGYRHIVVEVGRREGQLAGWTPGYYKSQIAPQEAFGRLIRQALVAELGDENVVRLEYGPAIDSQGREALDIRVVISPGAIQRLRGGASLDALVSLQKRLREMREDRTPIVEYVTEAELVEDGLQS